MVSFGIFYKNTCGNQIMKKDSTPYKRSTVNSIKCVTNELAKNYGIKNYDPVAKFKEQLSFLGKTVIPNLSGEYLAFEDLSGGKYHIKLWHVRSGAVFEVFAGLTLNAPVQSNPNVPDTPLNPESKR
jgi:hypothetical protein